MIDVVSALLPSVGILILFIIVIRAVIFADRRERAAHQKLEQDIARRAAGSDNPE